MDENNLEDVENSEINDTSENIKVVKTDEGLKDGQTKCPKCGATDISLNPAKGTLRCNFCRFEFEPEKVEGLETNIEELEGTIVGSGAQNIVADTNDVLTFKCSSCGAEVVIDTNEATNARCHWCRNVLSVNEQIPNGAVPDVVLPFKLKKEEAKKKIEAFVGKRKFYAHPKFRQEFTTNNVMGVYLPYMVVDINGHSSLKGQGEHETRSYTIGSDEHKRTYYDADLYDVERDFDIAIEGLTVESSLDKLKDSSNKTNNILNSIMPFDIENCVKWDANYLRGYTSEKRDTNIDDLGTLVNEQAKDIARFKANEDLKFYDRGVRWDSEELNVKGEQWKAAYLPVWLYSYQQKKSNGKSLLHYVAVNARTQETMGSVPVHIPRLLLISGIIELISIIASLFVEWKNSWLMWLIGIIYFIVIYGKYRNTNVRHNHESETNAIVKNMKKYDQFVKAKKRLSNSSMDGANNRRVSNKKSIMSKLNK